MIRYEFDQTSPLVVFEGLVIVGGRVPNRVQRKFDPHGRAPLGVLHHPAVERRLRRGHLGGRIVALHRPRRTNANPMAYRARSGRQFVVIATGGGPDAALVAFARPQ